MDEVKQIRIPIICGPTGSGKTEAALDLADQFEIEIVSADSRQMIKHLDIGTAKPSLHERERVGFHLVDIIDPGVRYTAFQFIEDASSAIGSILSRNRIPVIVGGTGLYLRALTEGVVEIDTSQAEIRERLEKERDELGADAMHRRLEEIDPLEAAKIHPHNRVRVIRALEIFYTTGIPKSQLLATGSHRKSQHEFSYYALIPPRDQLYNKINLRVDQMLESGLMEELTRLVGRGMKEQVRAANVIGYNELLDHIDGDVTLTEAVSMIKQNSRRYAKRQITWFTRQIEAGRFSDIKSLVEAVGDDLRLPQKGEKT